MDSSTITKICGRDLANLDLRNVKLRDVKINNIETKEKTIKRNLFEIYDIINDKDIILDNTRLKFREGNISTGLKYFRHLNLTLMNVEDSYNNIMEIYKLCTKMKYKLSIKLITKDNKIYLLKNQVNKKKIKMK